MNELIRDSEGTLNHPVRIFARVRIHEAAGDRQAAIEDFLHTLEFSPDHGSAKAALQRLEATR